jgi:hypothetical protein
VHRQGVVLVVDLQVDHVRPLGFRLPLDPERQDEPDRPVLSSRRCFDRAKLVVERKSGVGAIRCCYVAVEVERLADHLVHGAHHTERDHQADRDRQPLHHRSVDPTAQDVVDIADAFGVTAGDRVLDPQLLARGLRQPARCHVAAADLQGSGWAAHLADLTPDEIEDDRRRLCLRLWLIRHLAPYFGMR